MSIGYYKRGNSIKVALCHVVGRLHQIICHLLIKCILSVGGFIFALKVQDLSYSCGLQGWLLVFCSGLNWRFLASNGFERCFFGGYGKENR